MLPADVHGEVVEGGGRAVTLPPDPGDPAMGSCRTASYAHPATGALATFHPFEGLAAALGSPGAAWDRADLVATERDVNVRLHLGDHLLLTIAAGGLTTLRGPGEAL